jgi:simple sugar transport system permease protein
MTKPSSLLVSLVSIVFGLLVGALIMLLSGYNPIAGYVSLLTSAFGSMQSIGDVLKQIAPLLLAALGFTVAQRAGFFNIGLSGQALAGWIASVWFNLSFQSLPGFVLLVLSIIVGVVAGAAVAFVPGFLRAYRGASEVIITIMMNYIVLYGGNYLIQSVFQKKIKQSYEMSDQVTKGSLHAEWLSRIFGGSEINYGFFISLVVLALVWFIMSKTTLGFEIRSVGLNPDSARYSGINDKRTAIISMIISGGLAGLAGVILGLGDYGNFFIQQASISTGFDGMAVALLGQGSYLGVLASAALFGILKIGGLGMPLDSGVPTELVDIVTASIIFFVGTHWLIEKIIEKIDSQPKKQAPGKVGKEKKA